MHTENILILDAEVESAVVLKECLGMLDFHKVFISTNQGVMADLFQRNFFKMLFIDYLVLENWDWKHLLEHLAVEPDAVVVLMNDNYTPEVAGMMDILHTRYFLKKPFTVEEIESVLAKTCLK